MNAKKSLKQIGKRPRAEKTDMAAFDRFCTKQTCGKCRLRNKRDDKGKSNYSSCYDNWANRP